MRARTAALALLATLAVLGGCGGGEDDGRTTAPTSPASTDPAVNPTPRPRSGDVLVAALGDSITAGSPLYDPSPDVRARIGDRLDPRSQYEYWYAAAHPRYRFRNCGVLGERTDEIAERLEACAQGAQILVVQGGVNDIAHGRPVAEIAQELRDMYAAGRRLGLRVAAVEVLPWNNGYPQAAPQITRLNVLIRKAARAEGIRVFPWYAALEDPDAPGRMRPELTIEGDHPSVAGYRRLAEVMELP